MRTIVLVASMLVLACGPAQEDEVEATDFPLEISDATPKLTDEEGDVLFEIRFPGEVQDGPTSAVSGLYVEVQSQHLVHGGPFSYAFQLAADVNGDGRFGPGDVVSIREHRNAFLSRDVGTYRVTLYCSGPGGLRLGRGEWVAR